MMRAPSFILILVLMEYGLGQDVGDFFWSMQKDVLILVLLEYGLGQG